MVRNSDLENCDGKVSIQNLSTVSLPHRLSVVSVKVEDDTDLNSSNYSINLPQVDPKSTTSKNGSGKRQWCLNISKNKCWTISLSCGQSNQAF